MQSKSTDNREPQCPPAWEIVERLRKEAGDFTDATAGLDPKQTLAGQAADVIEGAARYAETLAVELHRKHWTAAPDWKPLTGDLVGLLTQIDNMTVGLSATPTDAQTPLGEEAAWQQRAIASILDHPSVFMGGPSRGSMQKAELILHHLSATPTDAQPPLGEEAAWQQRAIASILDHPSLFMGGPSRGSMQKAELILHHLERHPLAAAPKPPGLPSEEEIAQSLYEAEYGGPDSDRGDGHPVTPYAETSEGEKFSYRTLARAVLSLIKSRTGE